MSPLTSHTISILDHDYEKLNDENENSDQCASFQNELRSWRRLSRLRWLSQNILDLAESW